MKQAFLMINYVNDVYITSQKIRHVNLRVLTVDMVTKTRTINKSIMNIYNQMCF